jgi:hypothetical protein
MSPRGMHLGGCGPAASLLFVVRRVTRFLVSCSRCTNTLRITHPATMPVSTNGTSGVDPLWDEGRCIRGVRSWAPSHAQLKPLGLNPLVRTLARLTPPQAYHSAFNNDPSVQLAGNMGMLPFKPTKARGSAPVAGAYSRLRSCLSPKPNSLIHTDPSQLTRRRQTSSTRHWTCSAPTACSATLRSRAPPTAFSST